MVLLHGFPQDWYEWRRITSRLAKRQIEAGIHFLVPCGSTGEAATMTPAEHRRVVEIVVEQGEPVSVVRAYVGTRDDIAALVLAAAGFNWAQNQLDVSFHAFQDSRGFMWFGTQDGLNRYDGYTFVVYKNDPNDPGSLSSNFLQDLMEDDEGYLWVATSTGVRSLRVRMARSTSRPSLRGRPRSSSTRS